MHARDVAGIGRERTRHQQRAEMRAADADIDDVGDAPAAVPADAAGAHAVAEFLHAREHRAHLRHDVDAVDEHRLLAAQCRVQCRAVFRGVDLAAAEQLAQAFAEAAFAREDRQQMHGVLVDEVLRVIEQQPAEPQ